MTTLLLTGCGSQATSTTPATSATTGSSSQATTRVITDMAGRQVTIPTKINTVYCAVPTAEPMLYSLAPEKLAAWVNAPSNDVKKYLSDRAKNLPVLGGWMGEKSTANLEEIAKLAPHGITRYTWGFCGCWFWGSNGHSDVGWCDNHSTGSLCKGIQEPRHRADYSGRSSLRVPKSLHRYLSELAKKENVSINPAKSVS